VKWRRSLADFNGRAHGRVCGQRGADARPGRRRRGAYRLPLLGTTLAIAALQTLEIFRARRRPKPASVPRIRARALSGVSAKDRFFVIACGQRQIMGRRLATSWASASWFADPRFPACAIGGRTGELAEILERIFMTRDAAEWRRSSNAPGVHRA